MINVGKSMRIKVWMFEFYTKNIHEFKPGDDYDS